MIVWEDVVFCAFLASIFLNAGAYFGAGIAAARAKAEGRVPQDKPPFLLSLYDPFAGRFIEHVYTDLHRDYGSPFVTACIRLLRVTTPLTLVLFAALLVSIFV